MSFRHIALEDESKATSAMDWKPVNEQEWTSGKDLLSESESTEILEYRIKVGFKTEIYGTFRQSVVFDFGSEPVLVKHLCVDVVPVTDVDRMKEIRKVCEIYCYFYYLSHEPFTYQILNLYILIANFNKF